VILANTRSSAAVSIAASSISTFLLYRHFLDGLARANRPAAVARANDFVRT
jgi:hypothetical protein